ncbi:hypothetical protein KVV02_008254 [Mortierella alpina]|uniref:FYVE-type domain-containing protein n=1 Tax=Mortierella alpina TaxID=64518 RepID=A0A9P8A5H2_MORAP|nr:hypothetical protein KVV02_008254 [Mortierella alpina]
MTQPATQHSRMPPQHRQALQEQQQQQQQPQQQPILQAPTLQDIEQKYSQLPPQYRQAILEKQQKQYQQQLLEQQRGSQQQQPQRLPPGSSTQKNQASDPAARSAEESSSRTSSGGVQSDSVGSWSPTRQRNASAPMKSVYRVERDSDSVSMSTTSSRAGPGRAHWKPDHSTLVCTWPGCRLEFGFFDRRHHCRKCGDIFCSAHCSREVPLDQALDFNPSEGILSRTCVGCYEAFEQWQGVLPSSSSRKVTFGQGSMISEGETEQQQQHGDATKSLNKTKRNIGRIPDGFLGGGSSEEFGREDIVRQSRPAVPGNIAIKKRPSTDQVTMPMPSVPHDWSWSTF